MRLSTKKIIVGLNEKLGSERFKKNHITNPIFFTRNRCINFTIVMVSLINKLSKSLSIEITKYLQRFGQSIVSKQAYSKARYKVSHQAFIELNETFVTSYYSQGEYQLFRNRYLLLAADGSDYELPWQPDIIEEFGTHDNGQGQPKCLSKGVNIWDVVNQINISSSFGTYRKSEKAYFKDAWKSTLNLLDEAKFKAKKLLLLDALYPQFALMARLSTENTDFIISCGASFCREVIVFMKTQKEEATLVIPIFSDSDRKSVFKKQYPNLIIPQEIKVRVIRLRLENEPDRCLLISLGLKEFDSKEIQQIFLMRWGQETSFRFDKSRSEVENFASKKGEGIYQEFYANLFANNLTQLLIQDAQLLLDEKQKSKNNKHHYYINQSVAKGLMKDELPVLLHQLEDTDKFCNRMIELFLKNTVPRIPNRSFPRQRKHKLKFSMNYRRIF